jgi:hypothetical protein
VLIELSIRQLDTKKPDQCPVFLIVSKANNLLKSFTGHFNAFANYSVLITSE